MWRTLSTGRCFVYLLACREEDTQKIGFARDPWARLLDFHPRFHVFFDLGRCALIETDRVAEARRIERELKLLFSKSRSIAPLQVRDRAGGRHEWFRGIHAQAMDEMRTRALQLGYPLHEPLNDWLRSQWLCQTEVITEWIRQSFEFMETLHFNAAPVLAAKRERQFRQMLDRWEGIGVAVESLLDDRVLHWYRWDFDP